MASPKSDKPHYRSVWVSDVHLGTRGCKAAYLDDFLAAMWELIVGESAYHNGMIVRFPDKDTALAWYNSPAYQALLDIRDAALDCRFRLVG